MAPKIRTVSYQTSKDDFKKSIISLVVKGGLSLTTFSQPAMKNLLGPAAIQLQVSLDRDQIRNMVLDEARRMKKELKDELKKKCVYIKADAATRHTRNYMGINVQYFHEGSIRIKTLALRDTAGGHDSESIKNIIAEVVEEYDLHVLAIVVDNASAMTKAVRLLNEGEDEDGEGGDDGEGDDVAEIDEEEDGDEDEELAMFAGIADVDLKTIHHMRCAIHTLQLAVRDGLKNSRVTTFLEKVRTIIKKLRAPNLLAVIRKRGGLLPILDVVTRWGSTYAMLRRLQRMKEVVQDLAAVNRELQLSDADWKRIDMLANVLRAPYDATIRLQSAELTPGKFIF